jgi:hypothetical protein
LFDEANHSPIADIRRRSVFKTLSSVAVATALCTLSISSQALVVVGGGGGSPDCSGAAASSGVIWPPDHKMFSVGIVGVTDPNNLPISILVTEILQDESVAAPGSGNTSPDGTGVGTSTALVRAERAGPGTGRIYFISFSATNTTGQQCTGTVPVFVPHDQGQGFTPVDTGLRFDSTQTYF